MKKLMLVATSFVLLCGFGFGSSSDLPVLTSSKSKSLGFTTIQLPYANSINYFGYVDKHSKPDAVVNHKSAFYLYVWVPAAIDELGVRMISPVGDLGKPKKDDFVHPNFNKKASTTDWFDTWISIDRMSITDPKKIKTGGHVLAHLGSDDDGDDTYEEKRHSSYNSLLRIETSMSSPKKALVRGLYRITLTTFKHGEVKGSFVATIGSNIPGIKVAESLAKLHAAVNQ